MEVLLKQLSADFEHLTFTAGSSFCWSPTAKQVFYRQKANKVTGRWSLLHETGHALLEHANYTHDFELIGLEVAAWEKAKDLADRYDIAIDEDHIQNCLDSYRDWLHRRAICPSCDTRSIQLDDRAEYQCFNCRASWSVTPSRFCRPYRSKKQSEDLILF